MVLELVEDNLAAPVQVVFHPLDGRMLVTTVPGRVLVLEDGVVQSQLFLDVSHRISRSGYYGLQNIAFDPNFAENGFVFAHLVERDSEDLLIVRYERSVEEPDVLDAASEVVLMRMPKERTRHYAGQLRFGPDGYLYIGLGDDSGWDEEGTLLVDPGCSSISLNRYEGKILRIDAAGHTEPPYYSIPPDNPFVDQGLPEIWATGLRNPWRFSFDRETGDLWIGDVGESEREEINFEPAGFPGGRNYGWKIMEGSACYAEANECPLVDGEAPPACGSSELTTPVLEYNHAEGCSVTGGVVYRGAMLPSLSGRYLYGDYCRGTVWAAQNAAGGLQSEVLPVTVPSLASIDEDPVGEIYFSTVEPGAVYRLVAFTDDEPTCVGDGESLCLQKERFRISVDWTTGDGQSGEGNAIQGGENDGSFWFFGPRNPEIFVKVLDGCAIDGHYWVFAAGLTDVGVTLKVEDTAANETRTYGSVSGQSFPSVIDTRAFATCE